jgi:hypothetical protein
LQEEQKTPAEIRLKFDRPWPSPNLIHKGNWPRLTHPMTVNMPVVIIPKWREFQKNKIVMEEIRRNSKINIQEFKANLENSTPASPTPASGFAPNVELQDDFYDDQIFYDFPEQIPDYY